MFNVQQDCVCVIVSFFLPNMLSKAEWIFALKTFYKEDAPSVLRSGSENSESTHLSSTKQICRAQHCFRDPRAWQTKICEKQRKCYVYDKKTWKIFVKDVSSITYWTLLLGIYSSECKFDCYIPSLDHGLLQDNYDRWVHLCELAPKPVSRGSPHFSEDLIEWQSNI